MAACTISLGTAAEVTDAMWQELVAANQQLRATVEAQQKELADLRARVDRLDQAGVRHTAEVTALRDQLDHAPDRAEIPTVASDANRIRFSGEMGVAFFAGQRNAQYNNAEFRVDEATLRLEAEVMRGAYVFGELQLAKRETRDETFHLGEFYLEVESLGGDALPDRLVNLRVGRVDIPFGEEYLVRDVVANPLVTHSISDIWGTDEGIELYGEHGRASYAVALQNGNIATLRDFSRDKSFTARVGYTPLPQLRVSASYMHTGGLHAVNDLRSEVWIGNVVFRPIGSAQTTEFRARIAELDATWSWEGGRLWAAIGRATYDDNDPLADNRRDLDYYQVELVQAITPRLYGAVRYSTLDVDEGYPYAGLGNVGQYFFGPWTTELRRLSLGGGFRFSPRLIVKAEYAFENGRMLNGSRRDDSDLFSTEAVVGF